jgi:hypothetical protein
MTDPTKVLDALQSVVAAKRPSKRVLGATAEVEPQTLEVVLRAVENARRNADRTTTDHLLRVQARGAGSDTVLLEAYEIELVRRGPFGGGPQLRVWRDGCILAELELPDR